MYSSTSDAQFVVWSSEKPSMIIMLVQRNNSIVIQNICAILSESDVSTFNCYGFLSFSIVDIDVRSRDYNIIICI